MKGKSFFQFEHNNFYYLEHYLIKVSNVISLYNVYIRIIVLSYNL